MAFPVVQARNESTVSTAGTSHAVTLPAGIQSGDLLVVILAGGGTSALQFNSLAGWTELRDENVTFGAHVWCRQADGAEGATVTFTSTASSRSSAVSYRISGAEDPVTQAPEISTVATGTSNAPNPSSVSPTGGAKDYLWLTFFAVGSSEATDNDAWLNNAATNYSNQLAKSSGTGGTNVAAMIASCERTNNAASEDAVWPAASLDASLAWRAATIAVHPSSLVSGSLVRTQANDTSTAAGQLGSVLPEFAGIGTQLQGTGSTMNVPAPSAIAVGDILWVAAFIDTTSVTVTGTPSGWTQAAGSPVTGPDNHRLVIYWKRAEAGDTGASTFDFTLSGSTYRNAACTRFTGAISSGDPWDVTQAAGSNISQTTTEDVADTTTVADTLLVWAGTNWSGGTWTPPSGFTERRDTGDGVCTSADKAQAAVGSTGAIVGTCTSSDKRCAWMGALKPNADGNVTGTLAETQADDTAAATGSATNGTLARTQADQTSAATGTLGYSGTLARTQANQTSTASGVLGYTGPAAETQDNQTSTASGSVTGTGVAGSLAETQDDQISGATGILGYSGSVARTQANQTSTATGTVGAGVSGTVAETQDNQSSTASGKLGYSGGANVTQAHQTSAVAGVVTSPVVGSVAVVQANQMVTASGSGGFVGEPEDRTHLVPYVTRTYEVAVLPRVLEVPADPRTLTVPTD